MDLPISHPFIVSFTSEVIFLMEGVQFFTIENFVEDVLVVVVVVVVGEVVIVVVVVVVGIGMVVVLAELIDDHVRFDLYHRLDFDHQS